MAKQHEFRAPTRKPPEEERSQPHPRAAALEAATIEALISFISRRHGWTVSVPGAAELRVELQDSTHASVVDELREMHFIVTHVGSNQFLWSGRFVPTQSYIVALQ